MNADDVMISVSNVDKFYGRFQALSEVDLTVKRGERVVICGPGRVNPR